jgi:hypothetical protein
MQGVTIVRGAVAPWHRVHRTGKPAGPGWASPGWANPGFAGPRCDFALKLVACKRLNRRSGDQLQRKVDPPPRNPARCHANTPRRTRGWRRRGGGQATRNDLASGKPGRHHPEVSARAAAHDHEIRAPTRARWSLFRLFFGRNRSRPDAA